jgi:hypothetical protein
MRSSWALVRPGGSSSDEGRVVTLWTTFRSVTLCDRSNASTPSDSSSSKKNRREGGVPSEALQHDVRFQQPDHVLRETGRHTASPGPSSSSSHGGFGGDTCTAPEGQRSVAQDAVEAGIPSPP